MMRLLLLSNSTNYGAGYLEHAEEEIRALYSGLKRILFVPFALHDQAAYFDIARARLAQLGFEVDRLAEGKAGVALVNVAEGIFVGGGNTFRLLDRLQRSALVEPIRQRVLSGMPYMGSSAGTVIAAPTLMTTNDMPIVAPRSFNALGLVPFQINCHYLDPDPGSQHMGETREKRIEEYLEDNDRPVVGLREGAMLSVRSSGDRPGLSVQLLGAAGARLFRRKTAPAELRAGARLDDLAAQGTP